MRRINAIRRDGMTVEVLECRWWQHDWQTSPVVGWFCETCGKRRDGGPPVGDPPTDPPVRRDVPASPAISKRRLAEPRSRVFEVNMYAVEPDQVVTELPLVHCRECDPHEAHDYYTRTLVGNDGGTVIAEMAVRARCPGTISVRRPPRLYR